MVVFFVALKAEFSNLGVPFETSQFGSKIIPLNFNAGNHQIKSIWNRYDTPSNITPLKLTCPPKRDYLSREYIFQPLIFRGHVSFQGSNMEPPKKYGGLEGVFFYFSFRGVFFGSEFSFSGEYSFCMPKRPAGTSFGEVLVQHLVVFFLCASWWLVVSG